MKFEYPEDEKFFANLLTQCNVKKLHTDFGHCFDLRSPSVKRREFNQVRNQLLKQVIERDGKRCSLQIHPDCSKEKIFECDHIIPLSSNELNKNLRHLKSLSGKKIPSQSFGSNHIDNLILSCKRCNSFKKHKFIIRHPDSHSAEIFHF